MMSEEWDIQDTNGVQAIYIQPRSEGFRRASASRW